MNRKRALRLALYLMVVAILIAIRVGIRYDINPDKVVKAIDSSLLYGPSEILSKEDKGDHLVYLGKYEEYYSCYIVEKSHGFLYNLGIGYTGLLPEKEAPFTIKHYDSVYNGEFELVGMIDENVARIEMYEDGDYIKNIDDFSASMFYDSLDRNEVKGYYRFSFLGYDKAGMMIHEQKISGWKIDAVDEITDANGGRRSQTTIYEKINTHNLQEILG